MDVFSVNVDELRHAAAAIRELGEQLATTPAVKFGIEPRQAGHDLVAAALEQLQAASLHSVSVINEGAARTADRLLLNATTYETTEQDHLDEFRAIDTSSTEVS